MRLRPRIVAAAAIALLVAVCIVSGRLPLAAAAIYGAASIVSAGLYAADKSHARAGRWRISEATLHGVDLLCGVIGGLAAQQFLRHKTAKQSYALVTWMIAMLHAAALTAIAAEAVVPADLLRALAP